MILGTDTIRIKGKNSSTIINPTATISKTEADSMVFLENNSSFSDSKIEGARIRMSGAGDYEIGGIKFSTIAVEKKLVAKIEVDSLRILIGDGVSIEKMHDKIEDPDLVIVNADVEFNYSALTSIEPKVLIVYGVKKSEVGKSLGKTDVMNVNKFSTTIDKLPAEMQYVVLG